MKRSEQCALNSELGQVCEYQVVATSDEVERGEELLEESSEGQRLRCFFWDRICILALPVNVLWVKYFLG